MTAPSLPALTKVVAPSFSKLRKIIAEESPDPDLKPRYLLTSAAPDSDGPASEDDPALGSVRESVLVVDELSVTTVRPLERVVTVGVLAVVGVGVVDGALLLFC